MTHIIDKIRERRRHEARRRRERSQGRRLGQQPSNDDDGTDTQEHVLVNDVADDHDPPPSSLLYYSFEFFPPKTEAGVHNLSSRIERMVSLWDPLFVSVTFAPQSYHTSLELAAHVQRFLGVDVCLHVTCQGMNALEMKLVLNQAKHAGIQNLLVLRGDPPPGQSRWKRGQNVTNSETSEEGDDGDTCFPRAIDLVKWIKRNYGNWFGLAVAGHPEGQCVNEADTGNTVGSTATTSSAHEEGKQPTAFNVPDPSPHSFTSQLTDEEIRHLKDKVDAGADFIITQFFYDPTVFQLFVKRCRNARIRCPILPGILPVQSYLTLQKMTNYCGVHVPDSLMEQVQTVRSNDEDVKNIGCQQAIGMCQQILHAGSDSNVEGTSRNLGLLSVDAHDDNKKADDEESIGDEWDGVDGLHFYTLNLERSVTRVLTDLMAAVTEQEEEEVDGGGGEGGGVMAVPTDDISLMRDTASPQVPTPPRATTTTKASVPPPSSSSMVGPRRRQLPWRPSALTQRSQEQVRPINWANRPRSYVMRTDDWDEFPNGRWGDASSPAFGELSDIGHFYSPTIISNGDDDDQHQALGGHPQTPQDIYEVFARYVEGRVASLPWCESSLQAESFLIQHQLAKLNRDGFLTINSQPSVNGAPSHHKTFGWGQPNGYVYQKAYCECFCSPKHLNRLLGVVRKHPTMVLYAVNYRDAQVLTRRNRDARSSPSSSRSVKVLTVPDSVILGNGGASGGGVDIGSVTALTWGVFPNKEVVQPTIFDPRTFLCVWAEEAFSLWDVWTNLYDPGTASHELLTSLRDHSYLCAIVDNDYVTTTTTTRNATTTCSSAPGGSPNDPHDAATSNHLWDAMLGS